MTISGDFLNSYGMLTRSSPLLNSLSARHLRPALPLQMTLSEGIKMSGGSRPELTRGEVCFAAHRASRFHLPVGQNWLWYIRKVSRRGADESGPRLANGARDEGQGRVSRCQAIYAGREFSDLFPPTPTLPGQESWRHARVQTLGIPDVPEGYSSATRRPKPLYPPAIPAWSRYAILKMQWAGPVGPC